jgi:hypothetical protein
MRAVATTLRGIGRKIFDLKISRFLEELVVRNDIWVLLSVG